MKGIALDLLAIAGLGAVVCGVWIIYPPALWIVGGAIAVIIAIIGTYR